MKMDMLVLEASSNTLQRQGLFFSAASVAGAFSGLLAYAIVKMNGVGNLAGWRWIFILEVTFMTGRG